MTSDLVLCARDGSVAEVTLNRPEVMNALSFDLRAELTATFRNIRDRSKRCRGLIKSTPHRRYQWICDHWRLRARLDVRYSHCLHQGPLRRYTCQSGRRSRVGAISTVTQTGGH